MDNQTSPEPSPVIAVAAAGSAMVRAGPSAGTTVRRSAGPNTTTEEVRISKTAAIPGAGSGVTTPSTSPLTCGDTAGVATGMVGGGESAGVDEHAEATPTASVNTDRTRSRNAVFVVMGFLNS